MSKLKRPLKTPQTTETSASAAVRNRVLIGAEEIELVVNGHQKTLLSQAKVRVGTLLKADNVAFLMGAGCSIPAGGISLAVIPVSLEKRLIQVGMEGDRAEPWLELFYKSVQVLAPAHKTTARERQAYFAAGNAGSDIAINLEHLLTILHTWHAALLKEEFLIQTDVASLSVQRSQLKELIRQLTSALAEACKLPGAGHEGELSVHRSLVKRVLTRPVSLRRATFFTLNYDTLIEQACDAEGVVVIDGFIGTLARVFRPESFNQDLYFPAQTTEGRVHRLDRVVQLCKLHGSITWKRTERSWDNPYGLVAIATHPPTNGPDALLYPTPLKYEQSLGFPYSELLRRFAGSIVQPQSVLFVIGYGFGDEHVNSIILQALAIPSFTLVIVDPNPQSKFVAELQNIKDPRVWIFTGQPIGTLSGFVTHLLPDLRDEEILQSVMRTYNAIQNTVLTSDEEAPIDE